MSEVHAGGCLCRRVRFEATGAPTWVSYCHCTSCRRHTASPVSVFANFKLDAVGFTGERALYESSPGVVRSHCANCGTPIGYETAERPGEIDLYVGAFDEPGGFHPIIHVHCAERVPWFDTRDDLPRVDTM